MPWERIHASLRRTVLRSHLKLTKRWGKATRKFATMWIFWLRRSLMWRRTTKVLE
jgi:hypothetical protein